MLDGILGALGFSITWGIVLLVPWRNTIAYRVGDTMVTSTGNDFQHPDLLAYVAACLLPILHEVQRSRKSARRID